MKGIWKIFEFEYYDVLLTRDCENDIHQLVATVCLEPGNTVTLALKVDSAEQAEKAFKEADATKVKNYVKFLIELDRRRRHFQTPKC